MLVPGGHFPDDLDTTSLATMVLKPRPEIISSVLDEMIGYLNPDGFFQVSQSIAGKTLGSNSTLEVKRSDLLNFRAQ